MSNDLMKGSGGCGASWGISNLNLIPYCGSILARSSSFQRLPDEKMPVTLVREAKETLVRAVNWH
ncbi:hypothetical protein [Metallosphaera yellowstonensis]|uniref:hypothetical protein n=1 Tax=Metallosphaera yellowstonensis TaxID=1111107 RepID=UPI000ADF2A1A|nr:hypothetical protein [Metallosphaera yellowstonensis]